MGGGAEGILGCGGHDRFRLDRLVLSYGFD
jgi:hypothetical protein